MNSHIQIPCKFCAFFVFSFHELIISSIFASCSVSTGFPINVNTINCVIYLVDAKSSIVGVLNLFSVASYCECLLTFEFYNFSQKDEWPRWFYFWSLNSLFLVSLQCILQKYDSAKICENLLMTMLCEERNRETWVLLTSPGSLEQFIKNPQVEIDMNDAHICSIMCFKYHTCAFVHFLFQTLVDSLSLSLIS